MSGGHPHLLIAGAGGAEREPARLVAFHPERDLLDVEDE
jgi:hypothetical protein